MISLASAFGVTQDNARASVVTFSYYADLSIKFSDYSDIISFAGAVDKIPLMGSTTRIDRALRETQNEMFNENNGARPGVTKLVILLTDGSQTKDTGAEDPAAIAEELRNSGIVVLVIGIGSGVNPSELDKIAGGADNSFNAASFDELVGGATSAAWSALRPCQCFPIASIPSSTHVPVTLRCCRSPRCP